MAEESFSLEPEEILSPSDPEDPRHGGPDDSGDVPEADHVDPVLKAAMGTRKWAERFIEENTERWVSCEHPEWGRIEGLAVQIGYLGITEENSGIPDFKVVVKGKNNYAEANLIESRLRFHDSELEARERWCENLEN